MNGSVMRKFGAGAVIFVIYVCLYLLTILPRGGFITLFGLTGFSLSQLLGATVLFAATLLLQTVTRYKYRKWYFLIVALLPFVPEVIVYIAGSAPYTAVPDTVFKVTAVIIAWYAGGSSRHVMVRIAVSAAFMAAVVAMAFWGWDYWYNFVRHGSFSGKVSHPVKIELPVTDPNGDEVALTSVNKGYELLDFWSRSCGYCYKVMPEIERLHNKYKSNDRIDVYAVFCHFPSMDEMPLKGDSIVRGMGFTFPVLSVDYEGNREALESLDITAFPQYIIMDSTGTVVYHGVLPMAERFLDSLDFDGEQGS